MRLPRDRHRHDDRLLGLMATTIVVLLAETLLRIEGIITQSTGELLFGGGLALGIGGTIVLAFTAPASERGAGAATTVATDRTAPRATPVVAKPAGGLALAAAAAPVVHAASTGSGEQLARPERRRTPRRAVTTSVAAALVLVSCGTAVGGIDTAEPDDRPDAAPVDPADAAPRP